MQLGRWMGPSAWPWGPHSLVCEKQESSVRSTLWDYRRGSAGLYFGGLAWIEFERMTVNSPGKPASAGLPRKAVKRHILSKFSVGLLARDMPEWEAAEIRRILDNQRLCLKFEIVFYTWQFLSRDVIHVNFSCKDHSAIRVEGALE